MIVSDSISTLSIEMIDSNYVGTYYPWVKTIDGNTNKLTAVPPSTLLPGIYAANDRVNNRMVFYHWFKQRWNRRCVSVLNRLTHT